MEERRVIEQSWSAPLAGVQRQLLGAHFLLLARLLRRSARRDYEGFEPRNLVERRIILSLMRIELGRVSELAARLGNDVAQVSRALSNLRDEGLLERGSRRDPCFLTDRGIELGTKLDEVALRRDRELTEGLGPLDMFELAGLLSNLLQKTTTILAEELARARDMEGPGLAALPASTEIHSRVQPAIINIATTISRSATAAFKRLTDTSNYEWRILANIAERPGISFMDVVNHVDSDKGQVSRALDSLVNAQLLERSRAGTKEPVRFDMTQEGRRLHDIMREDALRRNALMEEGLTAAQRRRLRSYLELLIANAGAMAERGGR